MKRLIQFILFNFLLNICFGLDYNYYHRNELTGSYQIKNIGNMPEQYHFMYSMHENIIIGYYYDSTQIKFVDEFNGNKILKSTYYEKDTGKILYEKTFFYGDDLRIKSFTYKQMNDNGDILYEAESFFSQKDDKVIYNSSGFMIKDNTEQKLIIDGVLYDDYRPLEYKTYGMAIDKENKISQTFNTEEFFSYDNYIVTSKLFQNCKLYKTKRKFISGKIKKYEEIIYNMGEDQVCLKEYTLNDSLLTQIIKTSSESVNKYNYLRIDDCCCLLSYEDWDNSPAVKIEIFDEIVYIKNQVRESIKYPISLFDFSMFSGKCKIQIYYRLF